MKFQFSISENNNLLFKKCTTGLLVAVVGMFLPAVATDSGTGATGLSYVVPKEVQAIIDNYVKDSTSVWGFKKAKALLNLDPLIYAKDIQVGVPCQEFILSSDKLEQSNDSIPVDSLLIPIGCWFVPVRAFGRFIYHFEVTNFVAPWRISNYTAGWANEWQKVRIAYPESNGIDIKIISYGNERLLHFPKKGKHNLMYLFGNSDTNGVYTANTASTYKSLDDSWKILKDIKVKRERNKGRYKDNRVKPRGN